MEFDSKKAVAKVLEVLQEARSEGEKPTEKELVGALQLYVVLAQSIKEHIADNKANMLILRLKSFYTLLEDIYAHYQEYEEAMFSSRGNDVDDQITFMDIDPKMIFEAIQDEKEHFVSKGSPKETHLRLMFYIWLGCDQAHNLNELYRAWSSVESKTFAGDAFEAWFSKDVIRKAKIGHTLNRLNSSTTIFDLLSKFDLEFYMATIAYLYNNN